MVSKAELYSRKESNLPSIRSRNIAVAEQQRQQQASIFAQQQAQQKAQLDYERAVKEQADWQARAKPVIVQPRDDQPTVIGYAATPQEEAELIKQYKAGQKTAILQRNPYELYSPPNLASLTPIMQTKAEQFVAGGDAITVTPEPAEQLPSQISRERYLGQVETQPKQFQSSGASIGVYKEGTGIKKSVFSKAGTFISQAAEKISGGADVIPRAVGSLFNTDAERDKYNYWVKQVDTTGNIGYKTVSPAEQPYVSAAIEIASASKNAATKIENEFKTKLEKKLTTKQNELQKELNSGEMSEGMANKILSDYVNELSNKYNPQMIEKYNKYVQNIIETQTNLSSEQSQKIAREFEKKMAIKEIPKTIAETGTWLGLSMLPLGIGTAFATSSIAAGGIGTVGAIKSGALSGAFKISPEAFAIRTGTALATMLVGGVAVGKFKADAVKKAFVEEAERTPLNIVGVSYQSGKLNFLKLLGKKIVNGIEYDVKIKVPVFITKDGYMNLKGGAVQVSYLEKSGKTIVTNYEIAAGSRGFNQVGAVWKELRLTKNGIRELSKQIKGKTTMGVTTLTPKSRITIGKAKTTFGLSKPTVTSTIKWSMKKIKEKPIISNVAAIGRNLQKRKQILFKGKGVTVKTIKRYRPNLFMLKSNEMAKATMKSPKILIGFAKKGKTKTIGMLWNIPKTYKVTGGKYPVRALIKVKKIKTPKIKELFTVTKTNKGLWKGGGLMGGKGRGTGGIFKSGGKFISKRKERSYADDLIKTVTKEDNLITKSSGKKDNLIKTTKKGEPYNIPKAAMGVASATSKAITQLGMPKSMPFIAKRTGTSMMLAHPNMNIGMINKQNMFISGIDTMMINAPQIKSRQLLGTKNILQTKMVSDSKLIGIQKNIMVQQPRMLMDTKIIQRQLLGTGNKLQTRQIQQMKNKQLLSNRFRTKQMFKTSQKLKTIMKPQIVVPFPSLSVSMPKTTGTSGNLLLSKPKGYVAELKRRGKFFAISPSVRKEEALFFGETAARRTLGATFRIRESGKAISSQRYPAISKPSNIFRGYKISQGKKVPLNNIFIQKAKYRLSSPTERKEIQNARNKGGWVL